MDTQRMFEQHRLEIGAAIQEAIDELEGYGTGTSPSEIADAAHDQMFETTAIMTPEELSLLEAAIVREVLYVFGMDGATSDASKITYDQLAAKATAPRGEAE